MVVSQRRGFHFPRALPPPSAASAAAVGRQVERAKRELKATLVSGSGSTQESCNQAPRAVGTFQVGTLEPFGGQLFGFFWLVR